jgi:RNA polymerase sigma factor (sigma-70 family)
MHATLRSLLRRLATPAVAAPDADLLGRFARLRDEGAFAALLARHGPMVLGVCRRVLGDAHAAEDAFQATFLVLARKAASLRRPAALAGWLYGVATRVARKARVAGSRRPSSLGEAPEPTDLLPDPLDRLTARELLAVLEEEVQRLPQGQRLAVALCCLEGLSQEEAAQRLGCSAGAVKGRLERGRQRLHERLRRRGLTLSASLAAASAARPAASAVVPALARAAVLFGAGEAVPAGAVSAGAVALAEGTVRAMTLSRTKIVAGLLLALGAAAGLTGLLFPPTAAAPLPEKVGDVKKGTLWAGISVNLPVFHEGDTAALQLFFTIVNDTDQVIDPKIIDSKIIVNGKALADSAFIFGNGPRDGRFTALPAGDVLEFGAGLGRYFDKPGVYRVSWRGEAFRSPEVVFRVLPKKGPEGNADLKPARAGKGGLVRGLVERVVADGAGGSALLLKDGGVVTINDRTLYLAETGLDPMPVTLQDVVGKHVYIGGDQRDGKFVARTVVRLRFPLPD